MAPKPWSLPILTDREAATLDPPPKPPTIEPLRRRPGICFDARLNERSDSKIILIISDSKTGVKEASQLDFICRLGWS